MPDQHVDLLEGEEPTLNLVPASANDQSDVDEIERLRNELYAMAGPIRGSFAIADNIPPLHNDTEAILNGIPVDLTAQTLTPDLDIDRSVSEENLEALYPRNSIRPPKDLGPVTPYDRWVQFHEALLHLAAGAPLEDVMRVGEFNVSDRQLVKYMADFCIKSLEYTDAQVDKLRKALLKEYCTHQKVGEVCKTCSKLEFIKLRTDNGWGTANSNAVEKDLPGGYSVLEVAEENHNKDGGEQKVEDGPFLGGIPRMTIWFLTVGLQELVLFLLCYVIKYGFYALVAVAGVWWTYRGGMNLALD
jgi:hypothetical protein